MTYRTLPNPASRAPRDARVAGSLNPMAPPQAALPKRARDRKLPANAKARHQIPGPPPNGTSRATPPMRRGNLVAKKRWAEHRNNPVSNIRFPLAGLVTSVTSWDSALSVYFDMTPEVIATNFSHRPFRKRFDPCTLSRPAETWCGWPVRTMTFAHADAQTIPTVPFSTFPGPDRCDTPFWRDRFCMAAVLSRRLRDDSRDGFATNGRPAVFVNRGRDEGGRAASRWTRSAAVAFGCYPNTPSRQPNLTIRRFSPIRFARRRLRWRS